jgi:Polyketide cyclase / dehydrase and lipid transport
MPHAFNRLTTHHTPTQAFDFVSDFRHAALWDPRTQSVSMLTSGPVAQGSRFMLQARFLFGRTLALPYEIVLYERPLQLVFSGKTPCLAYREQVSFIPNANGSGTQIDYEATLSLRSLLALGNPLLALAYQRIADDATGGIVPALDRYLARGGQAR